MIATAYWKLLKTRQGWSWVCINSACQHSPRGGYGSRFASEADANRAARRHQILDHGDLP